MRRAREQRGMVRTGLRGTFVIIIIVPVIAIAAASLGCATGEEEATSGGGGEGGAGGMGQGGSGGGGVCKPGTKISCYSGPQGTEGVGACRNGGQTCDDEGNGYGHCLGEVIPTVETCTTPVDDDCDGLVNEEGVGCECVPGSTADCYTGPAVTKGVGICHGGQQVCNPDGLSYGPCMGDVTPLAETCATPEDDDCDGLVNEEGAGCVCFPGSMAPCYTGPGGTQGVGICKGGMYTCNAMGTGFGPCVGETLPAAETCLLPTDEDCDGFVNEEGAGCVCVPFSVAPCYSGPPGTAGVGICKDGTKTCDASGTAYGPCSGDILPGTETCNTATDDDCDGFVNEEGAGCLCVPGELAPCYTGPQGTEDVGACHGGSTQCEPLGTSYGPCGGQVVPATETCLTPADDDCDGAANEEGAGCVCVPGSVTACYSGPPATLNVGVCQGGLATCNPMGTGYGACSGETTPSAEDCFTAQDESCDGPPGCSGICVWTKSFGTSMSAGWGDAAESLEADAAGNIWLSGTARADFGPGLTDGPFIVKRDPQGNPLWNKVIQISSTPTHPTSVVRMAVDAQQNAVVGSNFINWVDFGAGQILGNNIADFYALKLSPAGTIEWYRTFPTTGSGGGHLGHIAVDAAGSSFLTGNLPVNGTIDFGTGPIQSPMFWSVYVVKLAAQGSTVWARSFGGAAAQGPVTISLTEAAADPAGNVFVTGNFSGTIDFGGTLVSGNGSSQILLFKLDPAGNVLWAKSFGGASQEYAYTVAADAQGNVVLAGAAGPDLDFGGGPLPNGGGFNVFVAKLDGAGDHLWSKSFGGVDYSSAADVALDGAGNIVIGGNFTGTIDFGGGPLTSAGSGDVFLLKLSAAGSVVWAQRFGDASSQSVAAVASDPTGHVLAAGAFYSSIDFGCGPVVIPYSDPDIYLTKLAP